MAVVLDAFASYLQDMVLEMAKEEVHLLLGVHEEIKKMGIKLGDLKKFLADADKRNITNESVQPWLRELKNAMYDATNILDLCQLKAMERGPSRDMGCFNPLLFCMRNPLHAHDIGHRIKNFNERLDDIEKRSRTFNFINFASYEDDTQKVESSRRVRRETTGEDELGVVGDKIEEDTRNLVDFLTKKEKNVNEPKKIKVYAIVGVGGIGKTTLAKKIFNHDFIKIEFEKRIWLSVNQEFSDFDLLERAIIEARGDYQVARNTKVALERTLIEALKGYKTLLVMDDVWDHHAWEKVLEPPLINSLAQGSRVLVTTRHDMVAQGMMAEVPYHHVDKLEQEDAWSLLKKQVDGIDQLKNIGMEILEDQCDGLPLAIKVVGGLLRMRSDDRGKSVLLNMLAWSMTGLPRELENMLYLSYEDLSSQSKQCFLYCSLFPRGQKIIERTITEMWASEGFITTSSLEYELEDKAIEYYRELIKRNFIDPKETHSLTGYICSMNNVVRSFAQYMARGEALVVQREQQIDSIGGQSKLLRRLYIESTESIPVEWTALQKLVSLRVLIINCKINFKPGDSLSSFSSLRVLHIVRLSDSDRLVSSLCQLKHLRYLYLYDSDISRLPDDIDRMKFLQYIGVVNCERFVHLPGNVVKLRQLRSLDLVGSNVHAVPRGFGSLTNLRSLFGFPVYTDNSRGQDWCSLEEIALLSQLRSLRLEGVEKVDASHLAAKALISSKLHLSSLQLNYSSTSRSSNVSNLEQQQLIQEVYEHLTPPPCLETLVMEGYIGRWLPTWLWAPKAAAFVSMRYMSLHNLASCTHLPDGLCQLPSLERLEINKAPQIRHVRPEFLHHCSLGYAFPRLQELVFYGMVEWRDWEWKPLKDVQALPALEVLFVESCKLRSLPPGLSYHARALRRLVITGARLLESLENFSSLIELDICIGTELSRIANLPRLQKLTVKICPKLRVLEGVPSLMSLVVEDYRMKTLPKYLHCVCPRYLTLDCTIKLLKSISMGADGPEWQKISHIQHVKAYAEDGGYPRKCSVIYTREPFSFDAMLDSEDNLTDDDEPVGSDIPSGSADNPTDDDEPVGSDIPSGSAENPADDELAGSDIPGNPTDDQLVGTDSMSESSENLTEEELLTVVSDIPSVLIEVDSEHVSPEKNDSELVGIEKPCEEIIKMLMHGQDTGKEQLQVVSICGIGGLGKTSIARAIYKQIRNQFKCCAFVKVSQRHADNKGIIEDIFDQIGCPYPSFEEDVSQQPIEQLIAKLKEFLQDKRCLIVLDNIWDLSVWETIKAALIGNNHGSGIITTTYKVDVAESIGGVYRLPLLSNEDSKILFYRRTYFGSEDGCPSVYRELTKRTLNKCGQLPLAIMTITSLLPNNRLSSEEEWRKVCNSIGSGSELGYEVEDMRKILSRSYYDLPPYLRTCFLYLRIFPEDYVIRRDNLVQRWLSEELICGDHEQNLHELGESYFYHLLDTGLIQPIEHDDDGKPLACRVPGVMIDLIASLVDEEKCSLEKEIKEKCALQKENEKYFAHGGETEEKHALRKEIETLKKEIEEKHATTPAGPNKVKRLSLQICKPQHTVAKATKPLGEAAGTILSKKEEKSFRKVSLSISCSADSMAALPVYKNLSVLVLEGSLENRHIVKYLGSLSQLTCLILATTQITVIPKKVGNLRFLQTLDLRATSVHELPCTFVRLKQLRCLLINRSTKVPAGISNLQALEDLQDIDTTPDILEGICALPELRFLRIALGSWDESSSKPLPETLCKLSTTKLKHLSICTSCSLEFNPDDIQKVLQNIEKLEIQHSTFGTLPTWIGGRLEKLSSLSIEVYLLEKEALETLARLPALHFLSLTVKGGPEEMPTANTTAEEGRVKKALEENPTAKKTTEEGKPNAKRAPEKGPTAQRAPEEKVVTAKLVAPKGFRKLKTFHLSSRAIGIKFQQGSMENLERLKLSFQASSLTTDDFSFGLENLSSLKQVQVEIICFSATEKAVKKAEDAIRCMIWENPRLPRPALDIRRSAEEYMIEDKREFREELRDKIIASWDARTASAQKGKQKQKKA